MVRSSTTSRRATTTRGIRRKPGSTTRREIRRNGTWATGSISTSTSSPAAGRISLRPRDSSIHRSFARHVILQQSRQTFRALPGSWTEAESGTGMPLGARTGCSGIHPISTLRTARRCRDRCLPKWRSGACMKPTGSTVARLFLKTGRRPSWEPRIPMGCPGSSLRREMRTSTITDGQPLSERDI